MVHTKYESEKPQIYFVKVPFELYEVIKKNEKKNDIIKVEIGYYFLQSGEYNECDSICTLKISLYYIYKFMCEDKNCCYTAKSLPYTSYLDWIWNESYTNVMSVHKRISQNHLFIYVYIHYTHIYMYIYKCIYMCICMYI